MKNNIRSIVFILTLVAIVLFLAGFRLGKRIERIDKTYVPPTPVITPTAAPTEPPLKFKEVSDSDCGVSFLMPEGLEKKVSVDCEKEAVAKSRKAFTEKEPAEEVRILTQKVRLYEKNKTVSFIIFNTQNGKRVLFAVPAEFLKLVTRTLSFK